MKIIKSPTSEIKVMISGDVVLYLNISLDFVGENYQVAHFGDQSHDLW